MEQEEEDAVAGRLRWLRWQVDSERQVHNEPKDDNVMLPLAGVVLLLELISVLCVTTPNWMKINSF